MFQGHGVIFRPIDALNVLCAQPTRNVFAIAKFLYIIILWLLRTIKCYSVVFGVTLRLVINSLSSSPMNNKQRCLPAMSVTHLPWCGAAVCITLGSRTVDNTR